jgi:hypothetical protein
MRRVTKTLLLVVYKLTVLAHFVLLAFCSVRNISYLAHAMMSETPAPPLGPATLSAPAPQGYFVDRSGRTVAPRVVHDAAEGVPVSSCDVAEGKVLWEESCEAVFGSFDPNHRAHLNPASTDSSALMQACPYVLAKALLSKTSMHGGDTHPLAQWLDGYDLLQRLLLHRIRRHLRGHSENVIERVGHAEFPGSGPLLGVCHRPSATLERWVQASGPNMTVPVGVASMLVKGLERSGHVSEGHFGLPAHEAGYVMYVGQHRRVLLCTGAPGPSSMLNRKEVPWSAYGVFPFAGSAAQVRLKDAANCAMQVFVDRDTLTIKLRCVATEFVPRGTHVRVFCPRVGLIDDSSPCLVDSSALQPGSLLQLVREQVLENTKPWRAQVDGQLSVIDAKLKAMLKLQ